MSGLSEWITMPPQQAVYIAISVVGAYAAVIVLTRLAGIRSFSKMSGFCGYRRYWVYFCIDYNGENTLTHSRYCSAVTSVRMSNLVCNAQTKIRGHQDLI